MEQFFAVVMRNVFAVIAGLLLAGGGLAFVGASLPAVVLFLLAGLLLMYVSSRQVAAQATPTTDDA